MQLFYILAAVALGVTIPRISVGSPVPTTRATEMLVAIGAGFVPFIGIVYSMLFLVVQFGSTTFTPRLNLFRDDPIVWHAFSFFSAVIVFSFTAAFEIGSASKTTLLVPIVLGIAVLVAVALLRSLQTAAFRSIQLTSILDQVSQRGREVIDGVHPERVATRDRGGNLPDPGMFLVVETPSGGHEVRWSRRSSILQTLNVPRLLRMAEHEHARIHLCVAPGETIFSRDRVAVVWEARIWPTATCSTRSGSDPSARSIKIQGSPCACSPTSRCARYRRRSMTRRPLSKRSTQSMTCFASWLGASSESRSWRAPIAHHESC